MSQEKANLARIRDNQRRSRARRKEYLQELEARLRQIELQGIAPSPEIQLAARRVADENKKLRALLARHGVSDDSIVAHLQSSRINGQDVITGEQFNVASSGGNIQFLERLLGTRKQCCGEANSGGSKDNSAASLQFMTPSSTTSCTYGASHRHSTGRDVLASRNNNPDSNPPSHTPQLFDFDTQLSLSHLAPYQFPSTTSNTLHAADHINQFTPDGLYDNIQYADGGSNEDRSFKELAQEVERRQNISDPPAEQRNG